MKHRTAIVFLLALATLAGAWMLVRPPEFPESSPGTAARDAASPSTGSGTSPSKLGAAAVLAIDPRANPLRSTTPAKAQRVTLQGEFLRAKNYKALYDRLKNGPEGQTPEGWYVMYEMLRRCANVTDRTGRVPPTPGAGQKREDFTATIPDADPVRDKRIAAFDDVSANRCAGMEGITIAQADLDKMLASAAAGGDAKAQALTLEQQLWAERRASASQGQFGRNTSVTLTDAQVASVQAFAGSRDPEAMIIAGRILSIPWNNFSLGAGTDGATVEPRALSQAMQLLACDYGYPCDGSNPRVLSGCAFQGHCNATSLADYIYYYGASPNDSQLMSQYQDLLRNAIQTGNWSQLPVVRGTRPAPPPVSGFAPGGG
jgi:hypothetical protein